jgi:hypothetical protein
MSVAVPVRRVALLVLAALALALLGPAPAQAHPFGPPQTVSIAVAEQGSVVRVQWLPGAADDFIFLAHGLGLDPEDRSSDRGALLYVKQDAELLAASTAFDAYLSDHIAVSDGGERCAGTVLPHENLVADGAVLEFDCGRAVTEASVAVSMLTDLHPAYRTLATGPAGQRFVYTSSDTQHGWSLTGTDVGGSDLARSAVLQLTGVLVLLGLLVLAGVLFRARARRRRAFA